MGDRRKPLSCMPLFSRVDRLDSTMKYLEGKQNLMEEKGEKQCIPMDLAVREAQFKGSLLDRITWLEQRLHKLSMQLETRSKQQPHPSRMQTAGETSSRHGPKKELSCSFPVFSTRNHNHGHKQTSQFHVPRFEYQGKSDRGQQRQKHPSTLKQQVGKKNRTNKEDKTSKSGKRMPPNWPHFKMLGC
ncbi:uncharacterized protein LOC117904699 isoform X1 [Vitis riparia]|uniref:uncharacterized protein LOC117904699 isoform X1 n=2 Tax=Vitis riparia TaxID=96939 RepID=UPI00155A865C|nr:uncharacterized protein LOC117904699 isoform X1 [Vitis riparia]